MHILYNFFIHLYVLLLHCLALFNDKVKTMLKGESQCFGVLRTIPRNKKVIWFHCASLGEFEQGRPLIEKMKETYPQYGILLSFYSPSGYEIRKNYSFADWVVYLPNDTKRNAEKFVSLSNPSIVFFIKYEFWYNYIRALKGRRLFQVSLILRPSQYFFKPYGKWFVRQLSHFEYFFVQDEQTMSLLNSKGFENVCVTGDTRFDRVAGIAKQAKRFPLIETFCQTDKKIILAGSTWEPDEKILAKVFDKMDFKLIIAPHLINNSHISFIKSLFEDSVLYSEQDERNPADKKVLVIDCIGILSSLYQYCDIAYIGGGFGEGIHNTLEAATFGKPVFFGPNYHKFKEAVELIERRAAFSIKNEEELQNGLRQLLNNADLYRESAQSSKQYVEENLGACERITAYIDTYQCHEDKQ